MITLDREQTISVGVAALILLICAGALGGSAYVRVLLGQEVAERAEQLADLETRTRSIAEIRGRSPVAAPAAALIAAPTADLAGAQLRARVTQLAGDQRAVVVSSGAEARKRGDPPDTIRFQATLDLNAGALQALLYQLENGTPYVFVDALTVQRPADAAQAATEEPVLRARLGVRALRGQETPGGGQPRQPTALATPLAAQPLAGLSATLERPLFSPSRRPPPPPPPPPPIVLPPEPPKPPELTLVGILREGEQALALVRAGPENKPMHAQIGDDFGGWKVTRIGDQRLVVSLDGREATFVIGDRSHDAARAPAPRSLERQEPTAASQADVAPGKKRRGEFRRQGSRSSVRRSRSDR